MNESDDAGVSKGSQRTASAGRLDALNAARVESDRAIARAKSEAEVYEALCRSLVRNADLPLVWVGLVEPGTHALSVQVAEGEEISLLDDAAVRGNGSPLVSGSISTALRAGHTHVEDDTGPEPGEPAARAQAREHGVRSYGSFPIRTGHMVVGVLRCLAREIGYFGPPEIAVLEQLTAAASHRLATLESESRRRHAEQRLTTTQLRYQGLFEMAPVAIMVTSRDGIEVNRAFLEMFGYRDQASLEAAGVMSIIDPADVQAVKELRTAIGPDSAPARMLQATGRRSDGSTFPLLIEGSQIDLDGTRSGLVFLTDLTALDAAETASRQSRTQLKALIDGSPLAIVSVDLDGIVRSWNVAAEQILGWTGAEVIGRKGAAVPPDIGNVHDLGVGHAPHLRGREMAHRRRDGSAVDLRVSTAPLLDRDGNPAGSMLVMEDLTDLNRLEAERARLATAIDQASESIVITDPNAAIVYVNPAFERLTGYARAEALGKNPSILKSGEQGADFYAQMWTTLTRGETWRGIMKNRRKDGTLFEEEATISPVLGTEGQLINYIAVKRDVTRERELERERDRSEALHRRLFVEMQGGMSVHDIICDADGKPVDYRFLDVNPAFEALTGLRATDIIGKTAREVLPNLEPEWVERYGRVALTGVPDEFESYNADLDRFYEVRAYQPAPGQFAVFFHDVTELRERTAFAETVIAGAGEGLIVFDGELKCVSWNPEIEELTGLPAESALGRSVSDVLPEDLARDFNNDLRKVLETGESTTREFEYQILQTGRHGWVLGSFRPHRNAAGKIIGVIAAVRDYTARHEGQEALRRSEEQFRAIFDSVGDGLWIVAADGHLLAANRVICERLGYDLDEILKMSAGTLTARESSELVAERMALVFERGIHSFETTHLRRDGTEIPSEVVARRIEFRGRPAILSVIRDVTERRRLDEARRLSEAQFRAIVEQIPMAIAVSRNGLTREVNDGYRKLFLMGPDEDVAGRPLLDQIAPEARYHVQTLVQRRDRDESAPIEYETVGLRSDGSTFPMHAAIVRITLEDGPATLGILTDVGEQRRAEKEREEAARILRESEEKYAKVFHDAPVWIGITDQEDGAYLEVNDSALRATGFSREEVIGHTAVEVQWITEGQRALLQREIELHDRIAGLEMSFRAKDGRVLQGLVQGELIDIGGRSCLLTTTIDITRRKQVEAELEESQSRLRAVIDSTSDMIWSVDATDLTLLAFNRAISDYLLREQGIQIRVGMSMEEAFPKRPEDLRLWSQYFERALRDGPFTDEYTALGSNRTLRISLGLLRRQDSVFGISVFGKDITEQKRADARFRNLFDLANDAIFIRDSAGRFLEVNRTACERLGYSRDELIAMTVRDIDTPENAALLAERTRAIVGHGSTFFETAHRRRDGSVVPVEISSTNIEFDGRAAILSIARDITDRKAAEEELRRSRALLRSIVDSTPDAVYVKDPQGRYLLFNSAAEAFVGKPAAEVLGKDDTFLFPAEEARLIMAADRGALESALPSTLEESVTTADGGTSTFLTTKGAIVEDDGTVAGLFGIARDITERRRIQDALELSEAKYSTAFRTSPDSVNINRMSDGLYLDMNDGFTAMTGFTREDIEGKTSAEVGIWADPETRDLLVEGLRADGVVHNLEMRFRRKDGSVGVGLMSARIIEIDGEKCNLTITREITDRKEAEERFRSLFENAGDAILIVDDNGRFLDANRSACERLGYTKEELLSMSAEDVDTPEYAAGLADRIAKLRANGILTFESAHITKDGRAIPSEITATTILVGGKPAILSIARDLSERRRAEAEKAALEAQLLQAQKMEGIGRLAGGIAHDFNNLLTAIRGNASLALAELPPDAGMREDLEQIQQAADRAAALTRQLLAFARRTVMQPEVVDLGEIVRGLEPMLSRLIGEDVTLIIDAPGGTGSVVADPGQIEQVVVNLAVNARDAMPDGGTLTISIADVEPSEASRTTAAENAASAGPLLPEGSAGPMTSVSVTDTGVGMDEGTLSHLFEPFFTTKGPGKGTGLGLATVYGIVRQSGGTVMATSHLGHGSTLTILLPRVEQTAVERPAIAPARAARGSKTGTILVVEDDSGVRRFATRVLEDAGYRVITTSDGTAAIKAAYGEPVQLLLTDVVMPGMSGREVALRLAKNRPGLRVLYMSGHTDKGIVSDGVLEPGIDLLAKPFTADALLDAVEDALGRPIGD